MIYLIKKYIQYTDWTTEKIGKAASWITTLLVVFFVWDVVARYVFNITSVAMFELEWHLFALIFLFGAAYALKEEKHVRVDVLYGQFSARKKAWINLLGGTFFLIPFCSIVIWYGWLYAFTSYQIGENSPDPGGLPARYVIKSAMPIGMMLLLAQGISQTFKALLVVIKKKTDYFFVFNN
jgi:TRAP-type mannitol/chloroaromatic compound transport system permease small subunit